MVPRKVCHIYTPVGMLGFGIDALEAQETLTRLTADKGVPTAIICDSGSTDSGPGKLASGSMSAPRIAYKRDLIRLIGCIKSYKIRVLIGSAGGAGLDEQVRELTKVIEDICQDGSVCRNCPSCS